MHLSGPSQGNHQPLQAPSSGPGPAVAFLLSHDMFELIYGDECRDVIGARGRLLNPVPYGAPPAHGTLAGKLAEAEAIFTGWNSPRLDEPLLQQMPRLRAVFHGAGSVRPYVSEAFWRRGIPITTAAVANAIPVAEYTLGAILLALKQAWRLSRLTRETRAFPREFPPVTGTRGATIGLVSLGLIGREVLRLLRPFEVRVLVHDPYVSAEQVAELGAESVSLEALMVRSDIVSLHSPLNTETEGLITGRLLGALKPGATFINTARGGLVQEPALIALLRERPDVQAILDVTSPEPPPPESPLYDLPNVFLTPHIAGSMGRECRRLGWTMAEEFDRFVRGEPLKYSLTRERAMQQT